MLSFSLGEAIDFVEVSVTVLPIVYLVGYRYQAPLREHILYLAL